MTAAALVLAAVLAAAAHAEPPPAKQAAPPAAAAPAPSGPAAAPASPPAVVAPPAGTAENAPHRAITLRGDRLTVRVADVPLDDVLRDVVGPPKAELKGSLIAPRNVTADFTDVPLQDGITRLLGEQNFLITYREDGSLRSLTLLGGPMEPSAEARVEKTTPPTPTVPPPATPADLLQRSVAVTGKLQQFLGQPTATMQQLVDIALRQDDAALRLEAMRAGMGAIDSQPDLRATVVKSLENTDNQVLENIFRSLSRDRAHEIASQLASTSRTPQIRARWLQLMRTLDSEVATPPGAGAGEGAAEGAHQDE